MRNSETDKEAESLMIFPLSILFLSPQCVLATYASILAIGLFFKLKPKKQAAVTEK